MKDYSVAITTYNRPEMTIRAIMSVIERPQVVEVILVDDASTRDNVKKLMDLIASFVPDKFYAKLCAYWNQTNLGMSKNKALAVNLCSVSRALILDSDNYILDGFFEAADKYDLSSETILMPECALPDFKYTEFCGQLIYKKNISDYISNPLFQCALNTCNYIVNPKIYENVYSPNDLIKETDTLWFNYLWLKAGLNLFIVPGMNYMHDVHPGSGWLKNADYNTQKSNEIVELIKTTL
jgi:glycosyltransferase involved in cell wall biosynthesis